jgi:hypothetical protein
MMAVINRRAIKVLKTFKLFKENGSKSKMVIVKFNRTVSSTEQITPLIKEIGKQLPVTILKNNCPKTRSQVKSVYYDYTITTVQEIIFPDHHVYLVNMEDETTILIIRICDGEMDVYKDLKKCEGPKN